MSEEPAPPEDAEPAADAADEKTQPPVTDDKQDPAREAQNVRATGTTTPGGGTSTTRDTGQTP